MKDFSSLASHEYAARSLSFCVFSAFSLGIQPRLLLPHPFFAHSDYRYPEKSMAVCGISLFPTRQSGVLEGIFFLRDLIRNGGEEVRWPRRA